MQSIHSVTELYLHPLINIFKGLDFILTCILYFKSCFFFIDMDERAHGCSKAREHPHILHSPLSFWGKFLLTFFSAMEASKPNHPSVSPPLFAELKAVCWISRLLYRCWDMTSGCHDCTADALNYWAISPALLFIFYSSTISCITF